jgi:hypothetical protein
MATVKQQMAVKKVLENNGNISKAMRDAGYPETTASNPQQLTRSKGWAELMEKYLPDEKIVRKIDEGLDATRVISAVKGTSANGGTTDFIDVPDFMARHKYIETSLKIKGKLDNYEEAPNLTFNFYGLRLRPNNPTPTETKDSA